MNALRRHAPKGATILNLARYGQFMSRKHKGDRDSITVRTPRPVGDVLRAEAERRGMFVSDYVSALLARQVGMPELAAMAEPREDQELPVAN